MGKLTGAGVLAAFLCIAAVPAWAQMTDKSVAEAVALKAEGKAFDKFLGYTTSGQVARFTVPNQLQYLIDLRTQLCYVQPFNGGPLTPLRCKVLKTGYSQVAPLITWDD